MKKRNKNYPGKTTLNLVIKIRSAGYYRGIILGVLMGIIVIGAFTKFAVADRLGTAAAAEHKAASHRQRYAQLLRDNAVYTELRAEYEKYFKEINSGETFADCMDALILIEKMLMTEGNLQSASMSKNELSVVLTGIGLEQASGIVRKLYSNEMVKAVSLDSADTTVGGAYSAVSLTISLLTEGGDAA